MCKHLWWWLLHGSGHLCKMLAHMHTVCVTNELYGLCKRTAITKWWMSNNVRPRVSYVIKPFQMHSDAHTKSEKVMVRTEALWLLHRDFVSSIVFSCFELSHHYTIQNYSKLRWCSCCTWDCKCVCACVMLILWIFECISVTITQNKRTNVQMTWTPNRHPKIQATKTVQTKQ